MKGAALRLDPHVCSLPILVLFPHNRCNCRCVMCDIWRISQVREITVEDLQAHVESLRKLQVRWVVFSGGEPQMHSDLAALSRLLRADGMRLTLLTAGLLLEAQAATIAQAMDDVIVSLDGPPEIHDRIRRVRGAFETLERGVRALREIRPQIEIRWACDRAKGELHRTPSHRRISPPIGAEFDFFSCGRRYLGGIQPPRELAGETPRHRRPRT